MLVVGVIIEYAASSLNRPFSYAYFGDENIVPGIRVLVPFGRNKIVGYVVSVSKSDETMEEYEKNTGFKLKEIISVIDDKPILSNELVEVAKDVSSYYLAPLISVYQTMLPPSLKPKKSSLSKPKIAYDQYIQVITDDEEGLTPKQLELFRRLKMEDLVLKSSLKTTLIPALIEKNKIRIVLKEKNRLVQEKVSIVKDYELNSEQQKALDSILYDDHSIYLLEGVTGSGKTEVYLQASKKMIENGKSVLMLVPEISLTVQMVRRFKSRFDNIAILHSDLTPSEKYDEYRRIARGEVKIVVGARSAIFAPLSNIGLIIIDEEHVESYKQETAPYYHALKVATFRAKYNEGMKIVLGSATPSLETKSRALKGVYHQLYLTKRFNDSNLPKVEIIDMLDYKNIDTDSVLFSHKLRDEISDRLNKKEQILLLLNRRGFAPSVTCRKCGFTFRCPSCGISLNYHKTDNLLKCHHCGYVAKMVEKCPKCGADSKLLSMTGIGTEKIEKEIERLFPKAKTLRLDSDVATIRTSVPRIISSFEKEEADILIGTQMIAKGHDFKNVTLVGIILADIGLNIPSFRAGERTFNLLTQAIGRAGRHSKVGTAVIQTYLPNNYIIRDAASQDYTKFFNEEMQIRKEVRYPPYTFCTLLTLSSKNEKEVIDAALRFKQLFVAKFANLQVDVIGPSEPFIVKQDGKYRRKLMLKYKRMTDVYEVLQEVVSLINDNNKVDIKINVDPYEDY